MPSKGSRKSFISTVAYGLKTWLDQAREAVMAPWKKAKAQPNPTALASTEPAWQAQVDRILQALTPILREGWVAANLPGDLNIDDPYIQSNLALTKNLLLRIPDEVHAMVVKEILEGVSKGETNEQIAARIDNLLTYTGSENWPNRARVIAQTELTRHYSGSMLAHGLLRERDGQRNLRKQWVTRMDGKERPAHELANEQTQALGQPFIVGNEPLLFPAQPGGTPSNVINCVPGDTVVQAQGVSVGYRFLWAGPMVSLTGHQGLILTASPNHPVLTERGWIAVSEVQQGDYLVSTRFDDREARTAPDVQRSPTTAEKIFLALARVAHSQRVHGLAVNFYGDRPDGDVDVVFADRELTFGIDSSEAEEFEKLAFACANVASAPGSALGAFFGTYDTSTNGSMGSSRLPVPLVPGHVLPLDEFGFGLSPQGNTCGPKTPIYSGTGYTEFLSQAVGRSASCVFLDEITEVEFKGTWHGYLYTFQTTSGIYMTNNIVSHNCRCHLRILEGTTP